MDIYNSKTSAVIFQNVCLSYGIFHSRTKILKDVNLNVAQGTIFGLLGPSGCGKTTFLKCIIASLKPDKGIVRVFNKKPGSSASNIPGSGIGYMPQELAIYSELTIGETLAYFGRLHFMYKKDVQLRVEFLIMFLSLPKANTLVKNLSGGEKRRVSFAIALLHQPPLLILDEPTVGVDPILRKNIWNYLVKISKVENVTIIITTHYIEEAKQADKVALMRNGTLLAQDEPNSLINRYNLSTLEDVFLRLCEDKLSIEKKQVQMVSIVSNISFDSVQTLDFNDDEEEEKKYACIKQCFVLPSIRRIKAVTILNFIKMWRNYLLILLQFITPLLQTLVVFWSIGSTPHNLDVAVFNQDNNLGLNYLQHINNRTIHQVPVASYKEGEDLVKDGKAWAVIEIHSNFSNALIKRSILRVSLALSLSLIDYADHIFKDLNCDESHQLVTSKNTLASLSDKSIQDGVIHIREDNTDQLITFSLEKAFYEAFESFANDQVKKINKNLHLPSLPVEFGKPIYGSKNSTFTQFIAPGQISLTVFFLALALTAMSFVSDKAEGLLNRTYVSGGTSFEIMCGNICTQLGVMVIQVLIMLLSTMFIFDVRSQGNIIWIVLLCLLQGLTGMTCGFFLSTISKGVDSAALLAIGAYMPIILTCGLLWPLIAMPDILQTLSLFQPLTMPVIAMGWIFNCGKDITWFPVWTGFLVCIGWILFFMILSIISMHIQK